MKSGSLTDFLLARIAEDEEYARDWIEHDADHDGTRFGSRRILAECEAKRRIVALAAEQPSVFDETIATLAEIYADHPDYQQEWAL